MRRFLNLFRRNRVDVAPERPPAHNPNFNPNINNDAYQGIEPVRRMAWQDPVLHPQGQPAPMDHRSVYPLEEIRANRRQNESELRQLNIQYREDIARLSRNGDQEEIQRTTREYLDQKAYYEAMIRDDNALEAYALEYARRQQHQGQGLKRHHKNRWIEHVKAYSHKHNIPYHLAIRRAKATYK